MGRVENYLKERRAARGPLHFSLIDPHKVTDESSLRSVAETLASFGTDAFLVGGSLGVSPFKMAGVVEVLREFGLPVIIFPGDLTNIVPGADAVLFMSLLNSDDPYYIVGAQMQGAFLVQEYGLEPLPTAYIIVGHGGAAGFVGRARPIPWDRPEIAAAYALSARMLGMRFVYLEAGSGAPRHIPSDFARAVKRVAPDLFLIIGGGIREARVAEELARSGADALVTGSLVEERLEAVREIIEAVRRASLEP